MSNGNHPHGDPNAQGDGYGYGDEAHRSYPQEGWGGEYDADATAFVQLPTGPLPPPGAGVDAWGPLAAPGTGQGGYTPPTLDPADVAGQPSHGSDPTGSGQWAMPFGQNPPPQDYAGGQPGGQGGEPPAYGQEYGQEYGQQFGQQYGRQQGQQYGQQHFPSAPSDDPGASGVTGQGAAEALAGSHEARTQRRPLGSGGGTAPLDPDAAEPIGPGTSFGPGQAEQRGAQQQAGDAQFADAHARRQVHFDGNGEAVGPPEPAVQASAYAPPHGSDGSGESGRTDVADEPEETDGSTGGGYENLGTVRSGLPWTPSSGAGPTSGQWAVDQAGTDGGRASGNGWEEASPTAHAVQDIPEASENPEISGGSGASGASGDPAYEETPPDGTATDEAVLEEPPVALAPELGGEHPHVSYVLHVNGVDRPVTDAWIGESLLYVLRERLGLAGAKDGCSQGECGACSVQVDGRLVASCLVPAATSAGSEIRTVEGLATDGEPSDVQRALSESGAVQCGFCVPGLAMTVHDLLEGNHAPSELETRKAICGNLCRCSGYRGVLDAVNTVVTERADQAAREEAEAEAESAAYGYGDDPTGTARIPHQAGPGAGGAFYPQGGGV
jgi:aerobic-type carbon monoxide dehydrogenase small subunit (CoxS/CutS family)